MESSLFLLFVSSLGGLPMAVQANCQETCDEALGMADGRIKDHQITASSAFRNEFATYGPQRARLNLQAWPPGYRADPSKSDSSWIMVDLGRDMVITGFATQGYGDPTVKEWVQSFMATYTKGDVRPQFTDIQGNAKIFVGNKDANSTRLHDAPVPVVTSSFALLPVKTFNNVGLRMELYGCKPGYYVSVWLMYAKHYFTLGHANPTSEEYKLAETDVLERVAYYLQGFPGFLSAELGTLSPHRSTLGATLLTAEVRIYCIKSSAENVGAKLFTEIDKDEPVAFEADSLELRYPLGCTCSLPQVNITLNKTLQEAKLLYTTQKLTIHANVTPGNCPIKDLTFSWEIAKATIAFREFGPLEFEDDYNEHHTGLQIRARRFGESILYIRCVAKTKNKVQAYDYGYVQVVRPPLEAKVLGRSSAYKGNGSIVLDASGSYDPHSNSSKGMHFSWYCRRIDDDNSTSSHGKQNRKHGGGCYGFGPGKLNSTKSSLRVDVDEMESNQTYVFELVVSKDSRTSKAVHQITVIPPYVVFIRCTVNCARKVSTNNRMIIDFMCRGPFCRHVKKHSWSLYKMDHSAPGRPWIEVPDLRDKLLTDMESANLAFSGKRNPLDRSTEYKIEASLFLREEIVEQGDMVFITNSPPHNLLGKKGCHAYPKKGRVLQTEFTVTCLGWHDEDLPLAYQLRYRSPQGAVVLANGSSSSFKTMLPLGNQSENYDVTLEVQISDSLGDATTVTFTVKVEPLSRAAVNKAVKKAVYGPNSTTAQLLRSGDTGKAALTSFFVLTAVDIPGIVPEEKSSVKDVVLKQMAPTGPKNLDEVSSLSAVVNTATQQRTDMALSSVRHAVSMLGSMTDVLVKEASSSQSIDMLQQVGGGLLLGMSNAIDASAASEAKEENTTKKLNTKHGKLRGISPKLKKKKRLIEESVHLMDKLGTSLLTTKVAGETELSVFQTGSMSMVLDRQSPSKLAGKMLGGAVNGSAVTVPSIEALIQNGESLDAQLITLKRNPYMWDSSSKSVTSAVVDFSLKTNGKSLDIAGLKTPFELFIPLGQLKQNVVNQPSQHLFVTPSVEGEHFRYHKISIPSDSVVAIIEIKPHKNTSLEIYVSAGVRPTLQRYGYSTKLPNCPPCSNRSSSDGYCNCSCKTPFRLYLSSNITGKTGEHYIGILLRSNSEVNSKRSKNNNDTKHTSQSSCRSGSGRVKRSCIGVKDPPTTPAPTIPIRTIVPAYSANTDVNYTISVSITSCLYWSEEKQAWTSQGCKVGPQTSSEKLHCLCTHLSVFGGDFFVAPNPIDFDKIWVRPRHPKDFVVLAVVCCIYGLYFVGLVLARRADNKDQEKVIGNVFFNKGDEEGCIYEVYIQTGIWKGFGTTANVGITIFGEEGSSGPVTLTDYSLSRKVFSRASVNNFSIFLPHSLGRLVKIHIWHDNSGQNPSWFLQQVMITDPQSRSKWYFFANKWLALERGSGEIFLELKALEQKERVRFKHLFLFRASRSLGDEHLWVSLFYRPPHSPFTRCQRLSCCLSFILSSMVTNAMFYQFSEKPTDTFKIGPLQLSWTQVKIGIQSGLMVIPISLLIIMIFRNTKFYYSGNVTNHQSITYQSPTNTISGRLPRCFVYLAWTLCILVSLVSSLFTVFYSLMWGADVANQWLTSITVSLVQDVLFTQPIKVIVIAVFLSLVFRKPPQKEAVNGALFYVNNDVDCRTPEGDELSNAKEHGRIVLEMFKSVKEVASFSIFIVLLMVVCYGNRDSQRFLVTNAVKDVFRGFNKVRDTNSFWNWTRHKLIPDIYRVTWYNGQPFDYKEGFISNRGAFLVGMPRLRQIRIRPEKPCSPHADTFGANKHFQRCLPSYSAKSEDRTPFNQPKWIPVTNSSSFPSEFLLGKMCPKPWRYQSAETLQTLSYRGLIDLYHGGGYVADLGYNEKSAVDVISDLQRNDWLDDLTVAVFVEFSVHEPSSWLFSFAKYLYERDPSGGVLTTVDVQTLALYPSSNPSSKIFQELCQLIFVVYIVVLFIVEVGNIFQQKRLYFTQVWNWIRLCQILTSIAAVVMLFLKAKHTSAFVRNVQKNPYETSSPDHIVQWSDIENYLLAVVIFLATLLLLRLTRFNPHVCQMAGTLRRAGKPLSSFSAVFVTTLLAYALMGLLAFGMDVDAFSSFFQSLRTVLQMSIGGKLHLYEIRLQHRLLSPLFLSSFFLWMVWLVVNTFVAILVECYGMEREQPVALSDAFLASFTYSYFAEKTKQLLNTLRYNVKATLKLLGINYSKASWTGSMAKDVTLLPRVSHTSKNSLEMALTYKSKRGCLETESSTSFDSLEGSQHDERRREILKSGSLLCHRHRATSSHQCIEESAVNPLRDEVSNCDDFDDNSEASTVKLGSCKSVCSAGRNKKSVARLKLASEEISSSAVELHHESKNSVAEMQASKKSLFCADGRLPESVGNDYQRQMAYVVSMEFLLSIDDLDISYAKNCFSGVKLELKNSHCISDLRKLT